MPSAVRSLSARCPLLACAIAAWLGVCATGSAAEVSFRRDVMAVLSKAGCNLGTCHGNARGKGGFQLSLRGQDPEEDYLSLTRDWQARRTNVSDPSQSLLLLKPTMAVAHEGGRRFADDSDEARMLREWIATGAKDDRDSAPRLEALTVNAAEHWLAAPEWDFTIRAQARFSDGTERDVTSLAVFEIGQPLVEVSPNGTGHGLNAGETVVLVRYLDRQTPIRVVLIPERASFAWSGPTPTNLVDEHIFAKLQRLRLNPAPLCDDVTFLRRVYLDLLGVLPTANEAQQFVADTSADKRARLIDDCLQRAEYADWWALKWADMLRVEEKTLDQKGATVFHGWLRQQFATNRPLDELVRDLISSRGSTYEDPPTNFYRSLRDPFARSESVGQLFLGVRLQCSKCHNHPFDRWTQDDYYSWASVFATVDYKILENRRRDTNDKHEFAGEQVVFANPELKADDPRIDRPRPAQLLGVADKLQGDPLVMASQWLTGPENDRFPQMLVNRLWRHVFGRGLVEPVDDFRATNPPSHPELLQSLAAELRSHGFDQRHLLRVLLNSRIYQQAATTESETSGDEATYAGATARRLTAEQLLDGVAQVCDVAVEFRGYPVGLRAAQLPGVGAMLRREGGPTAADRFITLFGRPPRLQSCECERTEETTLTQAFQLLSGELINGLTTRSDNRVGQLIRAGHTDAEVIDQLFWTTLNRAPTNAEQADLRQFVTNHRNREAALQDILWGLVTSHEFLVRR